MSENDDLASFFAQKKAKKGSKAKGIQSVDALAKKLEKSVKLQEELDREEELNSLQPQNQKIIQPSEGQPPPPEDSEWIEPSEEPNEVDLGAFKIREMDTHEEESEDEEVNKENTEVHRTWKTGAENEKPAEVEVEEVVDKKTEKFVPSQRRLAAVGHTGGKLPDIKDNMQFPSLADAADIETELEKKKKAPPVPPPSAWSSQPSRPAWGVNRSTTVPTHHAEESVAQVAAAQKEEKPAETIEESKPGLYVPPSMRAKMGTS